ncbi:MAG: hypothetical protein QUS33_12550 [Dehalococcoidia bacterium]|nr:hypothetical protein [Dehalococcoidia bacterium]
MGQTTAERTGGGWQADPRLSKVQVVICTISGTYSGFTFRLSGQRLLDALNEGFSSRSLRMGKDFVPLTDVQAYFPTGTRVHMASRYRSTYIRKANILFVGELSRHQGEEADSTDGRKVSRARAKKTIAAEIHIAPYILKGQMYAELWEELLHALDGDAKFLPLTKVTVWPELPGGEARFDFVAVNKDQVVYLGESPA